jgi:hypothetical protein
LRISPKRFFASVALIVLITGFLRTGSSFS